MKHKDLTIIEEFPISRIKEEDKDQEKMDISDNKNEKIINAIIQKREKAKTRKKKKKKNLKKWNEK